MRHPSFLTIAVALSVQVSSVARADKWPPPSPRIFAQANGKYAFKTLPQTSEGIYFTLDEHGAEKVIWRAKLVNVPVRAILSQSARGGKYVITLDTWGHVGYEHCLVIYGERGKVIADFKLEDLLTAKDIESLPASVSSRGWSNTDVAEFEDRSWQEDKLIIRMRHKGWAKIIHLTLSTGKLTLTTEPPAKPEQPAVKFLGAAKDGALTFELSNPNVEALPYLGYRPDSFEGGLKEGTIAPHFRIEVLRGKEWKAHPMGWCGWGLGAVSVPRKGKATFGVGLPGGDWDKFRVGVTWYKTADRKESAIAWSDALSKDDVVRKRP